MKHIIVFLGVVGWMISSVFSQITVNQSDMPVPGDTIRVSVTNVVPTGYAKTALDTVWNYAALEVLSQRVDTFMSATATPSSYQLFFVLLGGANLASPRSSSLLPGLPLSQGFTFLKNSTASFSDLGSAYTIQGIPLPAKYDIPDKLYAFPLTTGSTWSSVSSFAITVPNFASYSTRHFRSSIVDGWGTLNTPYGTFQTLRIKSTLNIHDSVYLDSLGAGFPINRNIIEYKWMAKGKAVPVLQVTEEGNQVTAIYRDFYHMSAQSLTVTLGPDTAVEKGSILTLHATVNGGTPPYQIFWNTLDSGNTITVTVQDQQTYSVIVADALQNFSSAQKVVSVKYPPGVGEYPTTQLQAYPNPTNGMVFFTMPETAANVVVQVFSTMGKLLRTLTIYPESGQAGTDLSGLPGGLYFLHISIRDKTYSSRLQLIR